MEDLQSTALNILNIKEFGLNYKISKLEEFKIDAEDELNICKSNRAKKDLEDYISWLDRQIESLKRNCTKIVR